MGKFTWYSGTERKYTPAEISKSNINICILIYSLVLSSILAPPCSFSLSFHFPFSFASFHTFFFHCFTVLLFLSFSHWLFHSLFSFCPCDRQNNFNKTPLPPNPSLINICKPVTLTYFNALCSILWRSEIDLSITQTVLHLKVFRPAKKLPN